jgi:TolB-like protein/Tfp pilus assembly protein PilF
MALSGCPAEAVRNELERVLASRGFTRNERLSRFLRVVVERHLEGRYGDLKESVIGIEIFGRKPGFDPKQDSTVRREAGRLRARLAEYYAGEGSGDPVIIELPKGGYTPAFRPLGEREKPRSGSSRAWLGGALAAFAVAAAATGWWWVQHESAPVTVAVLPLTNLGQDPANDYFADGLTDEIIRNLSIIDGLAVRSQTSSFMFKGKSRNLRETGEQLHADYILEGSVLRTGQQLRINAQLVRVRDDFPLWSGRFDRELTDVMAIQDEISRGIVNSLRLKLGRGRRRYETNYEAYDLYLRARAPADVDRDVPDSSIGFYQEAIAKDPSFAPAYAGLATAYALRSGAPMDRDLADVTKEMRADAEKAIQLDPLLGEAHDALASVYAREAQWEQSEKSFRHAIQFDANNSSSHADFAMLLLLPLGRIDEAVQQLRMAEKMDPLSPQVHAALGSALLSAGRYEEAAGHCLKASESDRIECLGRVRLRQGRFDEAIQILAAAPLPRWLGYAYGRAGRREEAEKLAAADPGRFLQRVLVYAGLGDKERTLEALDRMTVLGPVRFGRTLTFPELAFLRGDPRLKALRKEVSLPEP